MRILARLKISTKILALLLLLGSVTGIIALAGSSRIMAADDASTLMVDRMPASLHLARLNRRETEMVYNGYKALSHPGGSPQARATAAGEQGAYESAKALIGQAIAANPALASERATLEGALEELHRLTARACQLGIADNNVEALAVLSKADEVVDAASKHLAQVNDARIADDKTASDALTANARSASFWLLTLSVLGVVLSLGASLFVSKAGITGPLDRLKGSMQALAGGDNTSRIEGLDRQDEIGDMAKVVSVFRDAAIAKAAADAEKAAAEATLQMVVESLGAALTELSNRDLTVRIASDYPGAFAVLKENFNSAVDSLRATVETVSIGASNIRTGSEEIAQASEDLARRTEGNAASLEETSAALVQIETRLKATADASRSTAARADQAMATVGTGRTTAESAMSAMGRVSGSAKGIDSVIEGLDKIAFQTRVLAMNAAVEAGRAGDAGRGFAVVADLVSALAMRAEEEAKRARDQLTVTQAEIITAVDAVGEVDLALAAISGDVEEVNKLLTGMASDNQAQSVAISEITAAVSAMDSSTQQNAAMVEETSAAARNLTTEVGGLADAAAQFTFEHGGHSDKPKANRRASTPRALAAPSPRKAKPVAVAAVPVADYANGHASAAADGEWASF